MRPLPRMVAIGLAVALISRRVGACSHGCRGHDSRVTNRMACWFEVEGTETVVPRKDSVVKVSPIRPDRSGGHELIESEKS